jgi:hypothetical protein
VQGDGSDRKFVTIVNVIWLNSHCKYKNSEFGSKIKSN